MGLLSSGIRRLCLVVLVQASVGVMRCVWVGDHAILRHHALGAREMCSSGWIPLIAYAWRFIRDLPLSMKSCLGEPMVSSEWLEIW